MRNAVGRGLTLWMVCLCMLVSFPVYSSSTIQYTYDPTGKPQSIKNADGLGLEYSYDETEIYCPYGNI